ncbi:related to tol protein [Fusarium fujikuroi IMI 58289]|uniref:Related to tol protein n=2 Tax=Fusarium fujikuroi TaxID=5127 RepID=S0E760_GIBF5|nr:related to tol protein [Fusarium fujikuroi IMI 58289]KLP13509.1 tol protein [Fusarium fujikuroi]QGI65394.1 hypothetical protein CEK27_009365 [Fusarium fujikuroi]QGI82644.1 hypothetical protein CEK25_009373 [Fusarium fujikuroi]QGI96275.1 hypothetical protein CEK26_009344 [Fusarium fujikuroi]CCT69567.1 related to tol protein [Fusarium fujikuroi IMI 58289]
MAANFDPAQSDEANMAAVIHASPSLCPRCKSFPWPSMPEDWVKSHKIPLHESFSSLQDSADQGCAFCRFVWLSLVNKCDVTADISEKLMNGLIQGSILIKLFIGSGILEITPRIEHEGRLILSSAGTDYIPAESSDKELLRDMKSRHIKAFVGESIQQELAELIRHQIHPWMKSCREKHSGHEFCGAKYASSGLPTRLLDVGETNDLLLKLVEVKRCKNLRDVEYLILSYCWGNGNEKSKTTEANLATRLRGFAVSELSKTIQDAILLTRLMGFRYLWVDAICIMQGPRGDFGSEAPKMGGYYSNAACCISASIAKDSRAGFLTERPLARFPMDDIAIKIANHDTGYTVFKDIHVDRSLVSNIHGSPLAKRGWCLQETALPKRILHWTLQGLYLQCQTAIFSEDCTVPFVYQSGYGHFSPRDIMTRPDEDIILAGGWYHLLSVFSKTQLTYETDRLYAIHGLASMLIRRLRTEYFNGIFRPSLAQGLLWYHDSNQFEECKRPKDAQLPSWCWASACPVSYLEIQEEPIYIKDDHPERPLQFPTHFEALSVVESTSSRLYIRAPIFHLTIGRREIGYVWKSNAVGYTAFFQCRYFLDANRQVLQNLPQTPADDGDWGQGFDVLWFPVGRDHTLYPYVPGLLVYEVPKEGKGVYRRFGLLQCHDEWLDKKDLADVRDIILV